MKIEKRESTHTTPTDRKHVNPTETGGNHIGNGGNLNGGMSIENGGICIENGGCLPD